MTDLPVVIPASDIVRFNEANQPIYRHSDGVELNYPEVYRCTAKVRSKGNEHCGGRCRKRAIPGGKVCINHGGKSPNAIRGAEKRLAQAELEANARAVLEDLKTKFESENPLRSLHAALAECRAMTAFYYEVLVNELEKGGALSDRAVIAERLYSTWNERLAKLAKLALDHGLDKRIVDLEAHTGQLMFDAIDQGHGAMFDVLRQTILARNPEAPPGEIDRLIDTMRQAFLTKMRGEIQRIEGLKP